MNRKIWLLVCGAALAAAPAWAINLGPFGPQGEGGSKNGQTFHVGPGGSVFELAAFVAVAGLDLNGAEAGTGAELGLHVLPAGLGYSFSSMLSTDAVDVVLTYVFVNQTNRGFTNVTFAVMLDAEIDQEVNTFFNEYGAPLGTLGHGAGDAAADSWQIDEPGFLGGSLFRNLFLNALNRSNAVPPTATNDVALGLGFALGTLAPGQSNVVQVLVSQAGHKRGEFALEQRDAAAGSDTVVTLSGESVPNGPVSTFENATALAQLSFTWRLNYPVGDLIGTLTISNRADSGASFAAPFQLGLVTSTNYWYAHPLGTLPNDLPYVDLTAGVAAAPAGQDGVLAPGEQVVLDGIEVFSRTRAAPPLSLFEIWATRQ